MYSFYGQYKGDSEPKTSGTAKRDSSNYSKSTVGTSGSDLINKMYQSSRDALVGRLRESYNQQREAVQGEMGKVAPAYKAAKGDVMTQGKQAAKRLNELMRNQASGDVAQEQLQRNVATQQGVTELGRQERQTLDEYGKQLTQLKREEEAEITAGLSDLESQRLGALLDNYYKDRQFGLQQEQLGLQKDQFALTKDKFDYQQYRDAVADDRYDQEYNDEMAYREWQKDLTEKEFEMKEDQWNFEKGMAIRDENREVAEFNARMDSLTQPSNKDEFSILADMSPEQREYYNSLSGRLASMESPVEGYQYIQENIDTLIAKMGEAPARLMFNKMQSKVANMETPEEVELMSYDDFYDHINNMFTHENALNEMVIDKSAVAKYLGNLESKNVDPNIISELSTAWQVEPYRPPSNENSGYNQPGYQSNPGIYGNMMPEIPNLSAKEKEVITNISDAITQEGYELNDESMYSMIRGNKQAILDMGVSEAEYNRLLNYYK